MKDKELLEYCNEFLSYDSETGIFTWKVKKSKNVIIGDIAGCKDNTGYMRLRLNYILYSSHRLAFLMVYGYLPKYVDHINGVRDDNRIRNLRECTNSENMCNRGANNNNTSGYKGVYFSSRESKWIAKIELMGTRKQLGTFSCKHDAARAYNEGSIKYHGEFAYQNIIE